MWLMETILTSKAHTDYYSNKLWKTEFSFWFYMTEFDALYKLTLDWLSISMEI